MTIEAINELKKYTLGRKNTEKVEISVLQLNRVIKALEQEPCEDAISREMALKECHDIVVDGERYRVIQEETLLGLPSVTQKSGHWMEKKHNGNMIMYHRYKCSVCDEKAKGRTGIWVQLFDYKYNYCPNCGAKMESEE